MSSAEFRINIPIRELEAGGFTERTLQNVKDSDGTVVIYCDQLRGGTEETVHFCVELKRPTPIDRRVKDCPLKMPLS